MEWLRFTARIAVLVRVDGGLNNIKDCCRPYTRLSNDNGPRTGEPCVYKKFKSEVDGLKVYIGPAVVSLPLNNRRLYCLKQYQDDDAEVDAERLGRKINICLQIFWLKLLCSDNFCSKQPDQSCKCCHQSRNAVRVGDTTTYSMACPQRRLLEMRLLAKETWKGPEMICACVCVCVCMCVCACAGHL